MSLRPEGFRDGQDLRIQLVPLERIRALDGDERNGLTPAVGEEKLDGSNLVGGTGSLAARTFTFRDLMQ